MGLLLNRHVFVVRERESAVSLPLEIFSGLLTKLGLHGLVVKAVVNRSAFFPFRLVFEIRRSRVKTWRNHAHLLCGLSDGEEVLLRCGFTWRSYLNWIRGPFWFVVAAQRLPSSRGVEIDLVI